MKVLLVSILIVAFSLNAQAGEQKNEVVSYTSDTIKELKINSLASLVKNFTETSGRKAQKPDDIKNIHLLRRWF